MKKLFPLLLCCLLLAGCVNPGTPVETPPATEPVTETLTDPVTEPTTEKITQEITEPPTEAPTEPVTEEPPAPVPVTIYYGNANADGFETAEVLVDEINMHVLVEQLIEHGALTDGVAIHSLEMIGASMRLDFNSAFGDLVCSMGTSGERMVMGSVVNTFLDAYPGAETVSITVEGEILESGHVVYDFELGRFN